MSDLITVTAFGRPERGFCRAGQHWPAIGATHALTPAEFEALKQERKVGITKVDGKQYDAPPAPLPTQRRGKLPFEPPAAPDLAKENEALKAKLAEHVAQLSGQDARLASLEQKLTELAEAKGAKTEKPKDPKPDPK